MNERGHYGNRSVQQELTYVGDQRPALGPSSDYGELGAALGIGALVGILIGSNITFHSPVRRRQRA